MFENQFSQANKVIAEIEKHGHQAFFVGGCVRDLLLNRPIGDIDITTSATPDFIQKIFPKVIPVGIEHGTVIVRYENQSYEVTTFRSEGAYSDQRHPDSVEFIDKLDKDLERRDFTINAFAMNKNGNIIDLFNGKEDLQLQLIRTVGNSKERFMEDPLRIIRALRFSSQLGFSIETNTYKAIKQLKEQIENLAIERITSEIEKLFSGKHVHIAINYLKESEIYKHLPVFKNNHYIIDQLPEMNIPLLDFSEIITLFHVISPQINISTWAKEWKCSNKTKNKATQLANALYYYQNNGVDAWLVYILSDCLFSGFIRLVNTLYKNNTINLKKIRQLSKSLPIRSKNELNITGNEIITMFPGKRKGRWIQDTINQLEKNVVMGKITNSNNELKEWIKWNPPATN